MLSLVLHAEFHIFNLILSNESVMEGLGMRGFVSVDSEATQLMYHIKGQDAADGYWM